MTIIMNKMYNLYGVFIYFMKGYELHNLNLFHNRDDIPPATTKFSPVM